MANVQHSSMTGSSLHSSKIVTFTGDPGSYTPTESGIIVARTDVTPNKLYRTTGLTAGAVTEIGTSTEGTAATLTVGDVTTTTGVVGGDSAVTVTNVGNTNTAVFDFAFTVSPGADGADGGFDGTADAGITFDAISTPSAPGADKAILYPKTDGKFYFRFGSSGEETEVGTGDADFSQIATFGGDVLVDPTTGNVVVVPVGN